MASMEILYTHGNFVQAKRFQRRKIFL